MEPRADWQQKADSVGFVYHHTDGQAYWDESAAYVFTLEQIEGDIEPAGAELHELCLDLVDEVVGNEELMTKLAIPAEYCDFVAQSWRSRQAPLYGRFDFGYDGTAKPKLYEYNADTPTSVFEAATFQWLWLEDLIATGALPAETDQFNSLFEALRNRFGTLFPSGGFVHFAGETEAIEDRQTVRFFEDLAAQAGLEPKFTAMRDIGVNTGGQFVDKDGFVLQAAFKLYPWEHMLREPYAKHLRTADVRWMEPAWKTILSNKGILPLLWQRHPGHPNLLEAYFEDDAAASNLGATYVRKPLFSREGANIEVIGGDEPVLDQGYGAEGAIVQAYHPPPLFEGRRPVIGAWIVGAEPVGMGIREDDSIITKNMARFVPHIIEA